MRIRKGEIAKTILATIAAGTVAVGLATIPGAALVLEPFMRNRRSLKRRALENVLRRLEKRRIVEFKAANGKIFLQVTKNGEAYRKALELETLRVDVPKRWDGKWSLILFDIPESKKVRRDALRRKLRQLGCFQFHKSVFVHPAECEDEVDFVTELFQIKPYVTVFRADSLGNQEARAVKHFGIT